MRKQMKVYLDDKRPAPDDSWTLVHTAKEAVELLRTTEVEIISLDHDLGPEEEFGNGYQVLTWIEEAVAQRGFRVPKIRIHTANPGARLRMEAAVRSIRRFASVRNRPKSAD